MKVNVGCTPMTMAELARICGGMLCFVGGEIEGDLPFRSVCTDSREAGEGTLFVAMDGERVDGHDYIGAALSLGNSCVLCERIPEQVSGSYVAVVVEDSLRAIGELAKAYDRRLNHKKVAITGSVGKTTTKEFVAAVLSEAFRVHKTEGNYNSTLGMPMSLLALQSDTQVSVLEMGMSARGEIEYMSRIAEPDIAIITTIGTSHMEHLGSRENICHAKMEITAGLKQDGTLLLNGDEPMLRSYPTEGRTPVFVGVDTECDFRAVNIREQIGCTMFDLCYGGKTVHDVVIPTMGRHHIYAALFAFAVGVQMGLEDETILAGLCNYQPVGMRQNIYEVGGVTVIEDCYNASPESMKASIRVLDSLCVRKGRGRMAAVLGDMYELGDNSAYFHEEVGLYFAASGGQLLFTFGASAEQIGGGAILGGMESEFIWRNSDLRQPELTGQMLLHALRPGDTLLVKASRGAAAERIIQYLKEHANEIQA